MPTEPLDIHEYRAALLEWHQENVGQTQRIYIAEDSSALLQEMREDILRYANLLYNRYATDIDTADLSVIQQHFSSGEPIENHWHHEDIQRLLRDLIQDKQGSLAQYGRYQSILSVWYDLLEWVNDLLPGQNYVTISLEDNVPNFVHELAFGRPHEADLVDALPRLQIGRRSHELQSPATGSGAPCGECHRE